jgi:hypothetical protein
MLYYLPPRSFSRTKAEKVGMANDLQIMWYDLRVYLKGLEVALGNNDIKNAADYLERIKYEAEQNLEFLEETYSIKSAPR